MADPSSPIRSESYFPSLDPGKGAVITVVEVHPFSSIIAIHRKTQMAKKAESFFIRVYQLVMTEISEEKY